MTTDKGQRTTDKGRWLHYWAILTVCAALPLLLLGAEVTTRQKGMVDEVGFRAPWHLLQVSLEEKGLGFIIEHSHRVAGFAVGTCAIVLAVGLWRSASRRWLRWLGVAALAGVSLQGILGILRVDRHPQVGPELALVHGCFGQIVFSLLVSVAVLTSPGWLRNAEAASPEQAKRLRFVSLLITGLVLFQLVFGAILRHRGTLLSQRVHLLLAFAVVATVVWLLRLALEERSHNKPLARTVLALGVLVGVQVLLGVEAWLTRFSGLGIVAPEEQIFRRDLVRSAHVLVGALVLATSVAVTLQACRRTIPRAERISPVRENIRSSSVGRLEGVA